MYPQDRATRRSRMEILGDVLRAIRDGSTRPTQIMHTANLTWPPLMVYLEVLMRNGLVARRSGPTRSTYALTSRGEDLLSAYLKLKVETAVLESQVDADRRLAETSSSPVDSGSRRILGALRKSLREARFEVMTGGVAGRSGTEYSFPLVVRGASGSKYGFVAIENVSESTVIENFVKQLDTEIDLGVVYSGRASPEAQRIAALDGVALIHSSGLAGCRERLAFSEAFRGAGPVLLLAEPSSNYERAVEDLLRRTGTSWSPWILTWKGSRLRRPLGLGSPEMCVLSDDRGASRSAGARFAAGLGERQGPGSTGRIFILDDFRELAERLGSASFRAIVAAAVRASRSPEARVLFIVRSEGDLAEKGLSLGDETFCLKYDKQGLSLAVVSPS